MSAPIACAPCCPPVTQNTQTPGTQGDDGNDGLNGVNAFTTLEADFTVPAVGATDTAVVANSTWMTVGQHIVIEGPATFEVISLPNATSAILEFVSAPGDVPAGTVLPTGSTVSPSGAPGISSLTASATLNFGNTAAQNSSDLTIGVTGAEDGDPVALGVPIAALNANSSYSAFVSAPDTVTVRFNNYSAGAINPASGDFKVVVFKV